MDRYKLADYLKKYILFIRSGKGPVWWYPMEKMYSDECRPDADTLEKMKACLLEQLEDINTGV